MIWSLTKSRSGSFCILQSIWPVLSDQDEMRLEKPTLRETCRFWGCRHMSHKWWYSVKRLTSINKEMSCSNRGTGCTGSLVVLTCLEIIFQLPATHPYFWTHSMTPFHGWSLIKPVPVVVRSNVGSWNIRITPSDVAWTSVINIQQLPFYNTHGNWFTAFDTVTPFRNGGTKTSEAEDKRYSKHVITTKYPFIVTSRAISAWYIPALQVENLV